MIMDMLDFIREHVEEGERVALVTVTRTEGSSPASAGQMMAVHADGSSSGTVGGGATEYLLCQRAAEAVKNGERIFTFALDHGENGMVCGGAMEGFGVVMGLDNELYIFGGGHIAQRLAPLASATGFFVTVVEDRAEFESEFPRIRYLVCRPEDYEKEIRMPDSAFAVVCTRGHETDGEALHFCLSRPLRYLGMIGSAAKVGALFEALRRDGYSKEQLQSIYTPIGLDIASAIPAEIAVSILAEMLLVKNGGSPRHMRERAARSSS